MKFVYPNTTSTFTGDRNIALEAGYIEVEDSVYEDLLETKKKWKDGEIVRDTTYSFRKKEKEEKEAKKAIVQEILSLKFQLSESDYKAIKFAEGWITAEDYAQTKQERQELRDKINELEGKLQ